VITSGEFQPALAAFCPATRSRRCQRRSALNRTRRGPAAETDSPLAWMCRVSRRAPLDRTLTPAVPATYQPFVGAMLTCRTLTAPPGARESMASSFSTCSPVAAIGGCFFWVVVSVFLVLQALAGGPIGQAQVAQNGPPGGPQPWRLSELP